MPIPPEKMSVLWDGHLARLSYFCKRSNVQGFPPSLSGWKQAGEAVS